MFNKFLKEFYAAFNNLNANVWQNASKKVKMKKPISRWKYGCLYIFSIFIRIFFISYQ